MLLQCINVLIVPAGQSRWSLEWYSNWDDDGPRILPIKIGSNTRGGGEYRELDFQNLILPTPLTSCRGRNRGLCLTLDLILLEQYE